ncbi:hypothetical protein GCM10009839_02990 [Catenulispora yoronensis]|uniref:Uncharacterized protein n=1 Tax=Catenulispora yoronensis TaxID=450799 RepID=A0ABN2TKG5_9ACTN
MSEGVLVEFVIGSAEFVIGSDWLAGWRARRMVDEYCEDMGHPCGCRDYAAGNRCRGEAEGANH